MAQQPQRSGPPDEVDTIPPKQEVLGQEAGEGCGGSGGQEQALGAPLSPLQPNRLFVSGDTTITDDAGTLEGGSGGRNLRNDHSTAASSVQTIVATGGVSTGSGSGSGSGGGSSIILPCDRNIDLDRLFDGLRIEPEGGAATADVKGGRHNEHQLDGLHTTIQDLETYVKIETSKRLEAERRAESLEAELQALADRYDLEVAAREEAESAAKGYLGLLAEARAAWRKTQDIVQNKERELTAAENKVERETGGDLGCSLQRRLEDARKDNEMVRQHSASLKLALEGGGSPSLGSPAATTPSGIAAAPSAGAGERAASDAFGDRSAAAAAAVDANVTMTPHTKAERRMAEETENLSSPKAKLEGNQKAVAEARLAAAIAEAVVWRRQYKKITPPILLEQMARLNHVQHQQPDPPRLSPCHPNAITRKDSQLSPGAASYFPPSITAAALQKAQQQQARPTQHGNPSMPLLDLDWDEPSAAEGGDDDGQLSFAAPSPATTPVPGVDFFPKPPLPPRPRASPATEGRRDEDRGDGGDDPRGGLASEDAASPVRLVLPLLSFSDLPGRDDERKRAEQPQTQPQTDSPAFDVLEEIGVSDGGESNEGLGPLTQTFAGSNIDGAGSGTGVIRPEERGGGKCNIDIHHGPVIAAAATSTTASSYGIHGGSGSGTPPTVDGARTKVYAAAMPSAAGIDGCSVAEEKGDHREISANNYTGRRDEKDDVVRRAGDFLQALEKEGYRNTMTTLEVDLGSAVKVMSEGKFLELHDTKRGVGELLAALDASGLAF